MRYVAGIDVAEGRVKDKIKRARQDVVSYSDDRPDYSAIVVLEVDQGTHVASWHGHIDVTNFSDVCVCVGLYYNEALLVPEINSFGLGVCERIVKALDYPNVYQSMLFNRVEYDSYYENQYGFRTTAQSRPLLIEKINAVIEHGHLKTYDERLVKELQTMEIDDNGVARARGKNKDDMVMALGLALQGRHEYLTGTVAKAETAKEKSLPPEDRHAWQHIREIQERDSHDRLAPGFGHRRPGGVRNPHRL